jgi:hypothetical protein
MLGTGLGAVTARQDCDEARHMSARLLIRPAIRWARPVPAINDDKSHGRARLSPASESFGSVVITNTDTGSSHSCDRCTAGESAGACRNPGARGLAAGDNSECCSRASDLGQPRSNTPALTGDAHGLSA